MLQQLDEKTFLTGCRFLEKRDPVFLTIVGQFGYPRIWFREPGFATLLHIILEQQVSLASARATFQRLLDSVPSLTPANFLRFDEVGLKGIGFSRQKARYCQDLAGRIERGELNLDQLTALSDETVRTELMVVKGVGPWTANIYLMIALRRPDVWPGSDLALIQTIQELKALKQRPTPAEAQQFAEAWKPWRSVATRLLWHYYLSPKTNR
ncbi:MAG: DNA-3-methyladenine glycosylase family protein [Candidatus Zhuqueibacterota bacterium]